MKTVEEIAKTMNDLGCKIWELRRETKAFTHWADMIYISSMLDAVSSMLIEFADTLTDEESID